MTEIATKVSTTPPAQLFVVETIHTFHMRYLVESETAEGAREIVNKQPDDEEWQQKYLGDIVLTVQPISHEGPRRYTRRAIPRGWVLRGCR